MTFEEWWMRSEKINDLGGNTVLNSRLETVAKRAWNAAIDEAQKHTSNGLSPLKVKV